MILQLLLFYYFGILWKVRAVSSTCSNTCARPVFFSISQATNPKPKNLNPKTLNPKTIKTLKPKVLRPKQKNCSKPVNTAYTRYFCNLSYHVPQHGILNVAVRANQGVRACLYPFMAGNAPQVIKL